MQSSYLQIFIPIICLFVNVLVQILSFRSITRLGLLKSEYLGFFLGMVNLCILEFYYFSGLAEYTEDMIYIFVANLIIYFSLGYCYFHFINLGETARRIRILRELYDSKEGLSMAGITGRYSSKEIFEKRITRLINHGQVIFKNDRYYIGNPVMLFVAKIILLMKVILLGRKSEFSDIR